MSSLAERIRSYNAARSAEFDAMLAGAEPPPCFTCKAPSTHITDGITPAGYRAYQCAAHAPAKPAKLWGSDPGWSNEYITIEEARRRAKESK